MATTGYHSELGAYLNTKARMSTAILQYPSGRFGITGSIPFSLTKPNKAPSSGRSSVVFATEQDAIDALLAAGVTRFQLANCSFYVANS